MVYREENFITPDINRGIIGYNVGTREKKSRFVRSPSPVDSDPHDTSVPESEDHYREAQFNHAMHDETAKHDRWVPEQEDHLRDAQFARALHGEAGKERTSFLALMKKDSKAQKAAADKYFKFWDGKEAANETEKDRQERRAQYATLTRHYYDIASDFYEYGWARSFHFCRFGPGEAFLQALARHEHYLAHMIGIQKGMKVLDVGCGVGGPAREIARFTDCEITGLNNNDYQIVRAKMYTDSDGLAKQVQFVKGDFMQMSFPQHNFDAVYAIEATVHASSLQGVYSQIFRVLKPGGVFGVYEWVMTDKYDDDDPHHRKIRIGIEQGTGISNMVKASEALRAMEAAGFVLEHHEDLADRPDSAPWYWPLAGDLKHLGSYADIFRVFRISPLGRASSMYLVGGLEKLRIAPAGSQKTAASLNASGSSLVAGGQEKLFTPMYLMIARKPMLEEPAPSSEPVKVDS